MPRHTQSRHYEGPEPDSARRRKSRNQQRTPSSSGINSSATGSKRPASPSAEDVDHQKRVKRVVVNKQEVISETHESTPDAEISTSTHIEDTIVVNNGPQVIINKDAPRRRVRHSDPGPAFAEEDNGEDDGEDELAQPTPQRPTTQLPRGLTPHLKRVGAPTRSSRHARMSMPAQLSTIDETNGVQEIQFAPLRDVLDGRAKRRLRRSHLSEEVNVFEEHQRQDVRDRKELQELRRQVTELHKQIRELEFQKEAARMGNIQIDEEENVQIEMALAHANEELAELKASSVYAGSVRGVSEGYENETGVYSEDDADDDDDDDNDDVEFVEPGDINVSQEDMATQPHPNGYYASLVNSQVTLNRSTQSSQWAINDSQGEATVQTDVGDRISDQAVARFQGQIKRLGQEIADAHSALRILSVELQNLYFVEEGATTEQILTALRHTFQDAREELDSLLGPGSAVDLTNQQFVVKLLDHIRGLLAEIKEKTTIAEQHNKIEKVLHKVSQVDKKCTEQQQEINELGAALLASQNTAEDRGKRVHFLETEVAGLEERRDLDQTTIQQLAHMADTITVLEKEHKARLTEIQEQHAEEVQDLQTQLDEEKKQAASIEAMQQRIEEATVDLTEFQAQITRLQEHLETEKANRDTAEMERDTRAVTIIELNGQLNEANQEAQCLQEEIQTLRGHLDTERAQRETTEAELDQRNEEIALLEKQLHDAGIQANELRNKLFEIQMQRDDTIRELKTKFETTLAEQQESLAAESEQREAAETELDNLQIKLEELEEELQQAEETEKALEANRDELVAQRDERIEQLGSALEELEQKFSKLDQSTKLEIASLHATIEDLGNTVAERNTTIADLQTTAAITTESFEKQIEGRSHEKIERLESRVLSLEGLKELRANIAMQASTIDTLHENLKQRTAEHEAVLAEKMEQIQSLEMVATTRAADITGLISQIEEMKQQFRVQEEDTRKTIEDLQDVALLKRNKIALKAVEEMKVKGLEVRANGVELHKIANGRVSMLKDRVKIGKKDRKTKRQYDSGFGVAEDEDEDVDDEAVDGHVNGVYA
ncbi:hypothetical protein GQ43DRAFT_455058 [Delitschia confertaspora ATCC 74209]|uniref:Uncharacterized protein n=1 Tax=Delitschia confertaspora ATCC 74209 TaxID=1513339 RepID=A0A9P4JN23_9PLEO|nr:hypothetical protein GQ43DRAFT_455058 [Delitschia confertaspora ATCC 74209]